MTAAGWIAVAVAVLLLVRPASRSLRLVGLARAGRLAERAVTTSSGSSSRSPAAGRRGRAAVSVGIAAAVAVGVFLAVHGAAVLVVPLAAVVGVAVVLARDLVRRRRADARSRAVTLAVRLLVGELEAGAQPPAALRAAATAAPDVTELEEAARAAAAGEDPAAVFAASADPRMRVLGTAWRLGNASGVALAAVLGRVAGDFATAEEQRRSVGVALAGPRASATLMAGLPLLGIGLGTTMGARPVQLLTTGSAGRLLCCAGVLLDAGGVFWMRAVVRRAARS
jgi:tight adherence protein B